ncbi:hypothetical protein [Deinococcus sp.]|uniref:hypothetical protein n=1 Tax=Deinococcus sp. TaxID=47478 RepID=UPI003B597F62
MPQPERRSGYELDARRDLNLLLDAQDRAAVTAYLHPQALSAAQLSADDLTVFLASDDLSEVWASDTARPGSLSAIYTRLA